MFLNKFWIASFLINIFFLYAVFQTYFQSPVVFIHKVYTAGVTVPKYDRVVFFVCDGLRSDTFYSNPRNHPYLTSLLTSSNSVYGISDTRVPTESRPGHIALFAGIYEDPSAIFTGWKKNFVEFDSVFNRSKRSIALGSPDIVDMFGEGAGKDKVYYESYPPSWQEFSISNSSNLDTWVLERLKSLIINNKLPKHNQVLIFLHMLGVDNIGHSFKPNSPEYLRGVALVDKIVPEVEKNLGKYYNDNKTLFIFTSDHGMTDWGSHGAGSIDETETPFVIWGHGVVKNNIRQIRLKQADFAPLIAGSLGIPFPTNSIGRFPSNIWDDISFAYDVLRANFQQIRELMLEKKSLVNNGILPFVPFGGESLVESTLYKSDSIFLEQGVADAVKNIEIGMDVVLEGISYYERYDQMIMQLLVTYTFIIWMSTVALVIRGRLTFSLLPRTYVFIFCVSTFSNFILLGWSVFRLPYLIVPIYLTLVVISSSLLNRSTKLRKKQDEFRPIDLLKEIIIAGVVMKLLQLTFYRREAISIGLLLNTLWYLLILQADFKQKAQYFLSTVLVSAFPLKQLIGLDRNPFILSVGSILCALISFYCIRSHLNSRYSILSGKQKQLIYFQLILMGIASVCIHFPESIITRICAWISIPSLFLIPVGVSSSKIVIQLVTIFLGVTTPFIYLSLTYEVFFMPALFLNLSIFLKLELLKHSSWMDFLNQSFGTNQTPIRNLTSSITFACFHLCFVYVSFFGLGNIASISSFNPLAARCFISVFSPFIMMALLLVKIMVPFLFVACVFRLSISSSIGMQQHFLVVFLLCQGMALNMFLNVTNVGSWLEIGTSLSHYIIVQVTTLVLLLLTIVADMFLGQYFIH